MDWLAAAFELIGAWMVGNKNKNGFILIFFGCLTWVFVALTRPGVSGLLLVVLPALWINIRNYIKWKGEDNVLAVEENN